jgi:hypothetical protein
VGSRKKRKERKKEERKRKKNEILAKNVNDTQKQHISQALVSLSYRSVTNLIPAT